MLMNLGYVVVKLPLPPGNLTGLWQDPEKFHNTYFSQYPGYYFSGDAGYRDEDGYIFITGRVDDIINVAGHRLSTAEMEEVLSSHPDIAECAVFGIDDELKGQVPMGVVVIKSGRTIDEAKLKAELIQKVRNTIGPIACFKKVVLLKRLPKTRSGKVLRKTMRRMADHKEYRIPSTIEDAVVLEEVKEAFFKFEHSNSPE